MTRLFIAVLFLLAAQGQSLILNFDRPEIVPSALYTTWSGPFYVGVDGNNSDSPIILTLDRTGAKERIPFPMRGEASVWIRGLVATPDGTLIVAGQAWDPHAVRTGFLATISPDRKKTGMVRDPEFAPELMTVTHDGVAWVIGQLKEKDRKFQELVLRRFSPLGKVLTTGRLMSDVRTSGYYSVFHAARDRVGLLTDQEYTEFSMDGSILAHFPPPPSARYDRRFEFALREDLQAIVQNQGSTQTFWVLDRAKRKWINWDLDEFDTSPRLLGFDGDQLVLLHTTKDRGMVIAHYLLTQERP
jgi:hypothetical protein